MVIGGSWGGSCVVVGGRLILGLAPGGRGFGWWGAFLAPVPELVVGVEGGWMESLLCRGLMESLGFVGFAGVGVD